MTVSVEQTRSDRSAHVLEILVTNGGDTPLAVTEAGFSSAAYPREAVWPKAGTTVPAGATRALPVTLPDAACDVAAGPGRVRLAFRLPDGSTGTATVAPDDPIGSLERIRSEDCAAAKIDTIATVIGSGLRTDGAGASSVAVLTVSITPTGAAGTVELDSIAPTVLLQSEAGGGWNLDRRIAGSDAPTSVELRILPTRCDPHAVAEDKVGTRLPVTAVDAQGDEQTFPLELADGLKLDLLRFVASHCGYGG